MCECLRDYCSVAVVELTFVDDLVVVVFETMENAQHGRVCQASSPADFHRCHQRLGISPTETPAKEDHVQLLTLCDAASECLVDDLQFVWNLRGCNLCEQGTVLLQSLVVNLLMFIDREVKVAAHPTFRREG